MTVDLTNPNPQVSATSSTSTSSATPDAIARLAGNTTVNTKSISPFPTAAQLSQTAYGGVLTNTGDPENKSNYIITTPRAQNLGKGQPIGYKFNLPPHNWSLPVRPIEVDPYFVGVTENESFHGLRRGRIWYWTGVDTPIPSTKSTLKTYTDTLNLSDTDYAFQFLWNPTTISTSVSRNMDITPNSADELRVVAGVFPGQETVSLDLILDRTNDFACIKAINRVDNPTYTEVGGVRIPTTVNSSINYNNFVAYYKSGYPYASPNQDIKTQIETLMKQGTMADLEYLFKAINGGGDGNAEWTTLLGKKTSNVGYLAPTLLGIQLGPTLDNLSYVGWISNIGINHSAFTEEMIPLRTEVNISIQCFSGSGISSGA
jgi:hypothetical protein